MVTPLTKYGKLTISIVMDIIGVASIFLHPGGEFTDLIYAPIQAGIIYLLYKNETWALIALTEEVLPYTDAIPTATLAWFDTYVFKGKILKLK